MIGGEVIDLGVSGVGDNGRVFGDLLAARVVDNDRAFRTTHFLQAHSTQSFRTFSSSIANSKRL